MYYKSFIYQIAMFSWKTPTQKLKQEPAVLTLYWGFCKNFLKQLAGIQHSPHIPDSGEFTALPKPA
jgi:hypothetical protein